MNNENTIAVEVGAVKEVSELTPVGSFKDIAMPLVARGIPVIPIPPRQKGASLKGWQNLATTESEQIEKWNEENPQYNAGAVAKPSGFWMFGLRRTRPSADNRKRNQSTLPYDVLSQIQQGTSTTISGKLHASRKTGNVSVEGLFDAQVKNKYVVAAGSIHPSGKRYEVLNDAEIAEAPDWLLTWIKKQRRNRIRSRSSPS